MMQHILIVKIWLRTLFCLNKILKYRAYEIAINSTYDGYQRRLASVVYKFFLQEKNRIGSECK